MDRAGAESQSICEVLVKDYKCLSSKAAGEESWVMHCIAEFLQHGMFRYRLLRTFVYFFNFLSMMFSGKPLISAGGPENSRQKINPYLMLWVQAVETQRIPGQDRKGTMRKPLVPNDWTLIRRSADGSEKQLATNVLSWDISSTGQIVYTDGRSIYCCAADGTVATVTDSELIEKIVVLS
jgi:hypothetical protein